ncbi:WAS/WASL-interacting protein family member 1-like [Argopecten irradians]|uniref:WAS/WASL-interacting protein family member 1-like n=1 Tax=Argopecten irradians TaxID=31199 RepID=UPI0037151F33
MCHGGFTQTSSVRNSRLRNNTFLNTRGSDYVLVYEMPSSCMMSTSNVPPPLPARSKNLPPLNRGGQIARTASALGRPLPAPPKDASAKNNTQTLPSRNKKSPVTNYENHEIGMTKIRSSPAQLNKMTPETPPALPPGRPPKRHTVSCSESPNSPPPHFMDALDVPPALPSRGSRKSSISSSNGTPSGDLESRFPFHDPSDFPPPEPFVGDTKSYASKKVKGQHRSSGRRRRTPDLPPL